MALIAAALALPVVQVHLVRALCGRRQHVDQQRRPDVHLVGHQPQHARQDLRRARRAHRPSAGRHEVRKSNAGRGAPLMPASLGAGVSLTVEAGAHVESLF